MHASSIERMYKVSQQQEIWTYFPMNKQYVKGIQKCQKAYLMDNDE